MARIFNNVLQDDSCSENLLEEIKTLPHTLLEELDTLKKIQDIDIYHTTSSFVQNSLYFMHIDDNVGEFDIMSEHAKFIQVANHWNNILRMDIERKKNENDVKEEQLWESLPLDYRSIIEFNSLDDGLCHDDGITYEIKQRLFVLVDEYYKKINQDMIENSCQCGKDQKPKEVLIDEKLKLFLQERNFAERVINCMKFTFDVVLDPSEYY